MCVNERALALRVQFDCGTSAVTVNRNTIGASSVQMCLQLFYANDVHCIRCPDASFPWIGFLEWNGLKTQSQLNERMHILMTCVHVPCQHALQPSVLPLRQAF